MDNVKEKIDVLFDMWHAKISEEVWSEVIFIFNVNVGQLPPTP